MSGSKVTASTWLVCPSYVASSALVAAFQRFAARSAPAVAIHFPSTETATANTESSCAFHVRARDFAWRSSSCTNPPRLASESATQSLSPEGANATAVTEPTAPWVHSQAGAPVAASQKPTRRNPPLTSVAPSTDHASEITESVWALNVNCTGYLGCVASRSSILPPRAKASRVPSGENAIASTGSTAATTEDKTTGATRGGLSMMDASHGAPAAIHSRITSISASFSCFFGGICGSPSTDNTDKSKLSSGLPSINAGPDSPPARRRSSPVRINPPFDFPER